MPGGQERALRRRIGSTQNIKKITRAMELISATRVVKAQTAANDARPYSEHITQVITDLATGGASVDHPLLRQPEQVRKVGIVVLSSDRGMAGAYNAGVIRATERELNAFRSEGLDYSLVTVGRKAASYFRFRGYTLTESFEGMSDKPTYEDARTIARSVVDLFDGDVDRIVLVYTQFISMGTQKVTIRRFLPLETDLDVDADGAEGGSSGPSGPSAQFEFEPSPNAVLESLLPRYVESRLFSALLDSAASEHASRQRAMKSATDNAEDLILKLSRKMNQARQDSITTEIMEIIGGAEALGDDKGSPEDLLLDHLDSDPFPPLNHRRHFAHNPES